MGWDVDVAGVSRVLQDTATHGDDLVCAWQGSDGGTQGVVQVAQLVVTYSQSALIGKALQEFFEVREKTVSVMAERLQGSLTGVGEAVKAIVFGDETMAAQIGQQMDAAAGSGNFLGLAGLG